MPAPKNKECVLLLDQDSWRPVVAPLHKHTIIERVHLAPNIIHERVWICQNDERSLTGQRIFRELLKAAVSEPSEHPLYDELVIKTPLPFVWPES